MKKLTVVLAVFALAATLVASALPGSAMARGSGGPANQHRGCMSNNGIPLDDGQSVVVDGVTITCNNGQVCHFAKGQVPLCYVNVWAEAANAGSISTGGTVGGTKKITFKVPVKRASTLAAKTR
jgi:hypothetical protein